MSREKRLATPAGVVSPERVRALTPKADKYKQQAADFIHTNRLGGYIGARGPVDADTLRGEVALRIAERSVTSAEEIRERHTGSLARRVLMFIKEAPVSDDDYQARRDAKDFLAAEQGNVLQDKYEGHRDRFFAIRDAVRDLFGREEMRNLSGNPSTNGFALGGTGIESRELPQTLLEEWGQTWMEKVLG